MRLPVSPQVLHNELEVARAIIEKWQKQITDGIPAIESVGSPEALMEWLIEFCGELRVVSGKCDVLVDAIESGLSS